MKYLEPTQEAATRLITRKIEGEVTMLNLIRLREVANYTNYPELAPRNPISGREAFQKYIDHTLPFLKQSGGQLLFLGKGSDYFIGPSEEKWDLVMLVRQKSVQSFFAFASDPECMLGVGHRTAAIVDSRLLPIIESKMKR